MDWLIPSAFAAEAAPGGADSGFFIIMISFVLIFYFLVWRPQSKQNKEHRALIEGLQKGDEVITNGGVYGKIVKVGEHFLLVEVADKVQLRLQKGAVSKGLPKGTIKEMA